MTSRYGDYDAKISEIKRDYIKVKHQKLNGSKLSIRQSVHERQAWCQANCSDDYHITWWNGYFKLIEDAAYYKMTWG